MDGPEWAQLPPELIHEISTHLSTYTDHLSLRATCRAWRSTLPKTPSHLPPQPPWLLLPNNRQSSFAFLDISSNKTLLLSLPEAAKNLPLSSSHGFLLILQDSPNILLLNPLTRARVPLPPFSAFPLVLSFDYSHVGREYSLSNGPNGQTYTLSLRQMRDSFISKLVLSSDPTGFFAAAILGRTADVALCRNGDSSWRIANAARSYSEDILFFNGKFLAVNKIGQIAVIDINNNNNPLVVNFIETTPRGGDMQYLVGYGDELLLVSRFLEVSNSESNLSLRTVRLEVYRMEFGGPRWERVSSLGDVALFVGRNSSVSVLVSGLGSDFPGCVGDCVYYTDDFSEMDVDGDGGWWDVEVFRMWDGRIEPLLCCSLGSGLGRFWPPPVWVCPNPG